MFIRQFFPALISAVVSLTLPIFMIINLIMHGFGVGGAVRFSKQLAQGQGKECFCLGAAKGHSGFADVSGKGVEKHERIYITGVGGAS